MTKKILTALLSVIILIQVYQIDRDNPESAPELDFLKMVEVPENIATTMHTACYDCHSNETVYPWYAYVAPVSWMVGDHVEEGREHLNFSEWGNMTEEDQEHAFEEIAEEVEEGKMPEDDYTMMHGDAELSDAQREAFVEWFEAKYKAAHH